MSDDFPIRVPLSPSPTQWSLSDLGDPPDIEGWLSEEDVRQIMLYPIIVSSHLVFSQEEPKHKHIEDLDSGLAALKALVPNEWSSANPCVAEVLDITCQYIKHRKKVERENIATWEREIAALTAYAESFEKKCEELSKDKEHLAKELERVMAMQHQNQKGADEESDVTERKQNTGMKRAREVDAEESSDEKKPKITP